MLAILHVMDIWPIEKEREAELVYGTRNPEHAGVRYLFDSAGKYYVGGAIEGIQLPLHPVAGKVNPGVNDPYEIPENPEVYIDTTDMTPDEAAQEVLLYLDRAGYMR